MDGEKTLTISMDTAICAARFIVAAHKSCCTGKPVDFCDICCANGYQPNCSTPCRRDMAWHDNVLDWRSMLEPLFAAAGIYPLLMEGDYEALDDCSPNQQ